jgi:hypothetical protein
MAVAQTQHIATKTAGMLIASPLLGINTLFICHRRPIGILLEYPEWQIVTVYQSKEWLSSKTYDRLVGTLYRSFCLAGCTSLLVLRLRESTIALFRLGLYVSSKRRVQFLPIHLCTHQ